MTTDASITTWSGRTQEAKNKDEISVKDFGLVGDGVTDNLATWNILISSGYKNFFVPEGVYCFSGSIDKPNNITLRGIGSPILSFGTGADFYEFKTTGKLGIRGSIFLFKQPTIPNNLKTATATNRTDDMSSVTYCMRETQSGKGASSLTGIAIVQDMNLFRADNSVIFPNDSDYNIASDYQCGLYIDDTAKGKYNDLCIFGYFSKAGLVIQSKPDNDDPDYNTFYNCQFTGRYGVALLGANDAPAAYGLSGSRFNTCGIYTLDHRSRGEMTNDQRIAYYATADKWRCIYIDGDVNASNAEINGHYFSQCEIRSRVDHPLELDHASNVHFNQCVFEQTNYNIPNSMPNPTFIASVNTVRSVSFVGCRINYNSLIFNSGFAGSIGTGILIIGNPSNFITAVTSNPTNGTWNISTLGTDRNTGDIGVQLTSNVESGSSGWRLQRKVSNDNFEILKEGILKFSATATGVYTYTTPVGNDFFMGLLANGNVNSWYLRTQYSNGQIQFRPGTSNGSIAFALSDQGVISSTLPTASIGTTTTPYNNAYIAKLNLTTAVSIQSGTGSPEGIVMAAVGSLYLRADGTTGTTLYVKQSGTGNTGWVAK